IYYYIYIYILYIYIYYIIYIYILLYIYIYIYSYIHIHYNILGHMYITSHYFPLLLSLLPLLTLLLLSLTLPTSAPDTTDVVIIWDITLIPHHTTSYSRAPVSTISCDARHAILRQKE